MSDYMESLFQGVDILIDKRLENLSYDTTEICTIIDNSLRKNGEYRVTDGSISYIAYSENNNYRNGEQVRVSIPKGDYSQRKFIIGKYISDEDSSPITYVSPLDTVIDLSGNVLGNSVFNKQYGIIANGSEIKKTIYSKKFTNEEFRNFNDSDIWNSIALQANFKTTFDRTQLVVSGTYGLRIILYVKPSEESKYTMTKVLELNNNDMFGNPYNFIIYSPQVKVFDITSFNGIIEGLDLEIFQQGDFRQGQLNGPLVPASKFDNIIVKNIVLSFGSNVLNVENNTLKIYSTDSALYKYNPHNEDTNLKRINLLWYNSDEDNKFIGFSDGVYDNDYDELEYLEKSRKNTRLIAQKNRENIPPEEKALGLAANIEEAIPAIQKAAKVISQDMRQLLREMSRLIVDTPFLTDAIERLLSSQSGYENKCLVTKTDNIIELLGNSTSGMAGQYAAILKFAHDTWKDKTPTWPDTVLDYNKQILDIFYDIESVVTNLFSKDLKKVETTYKGYKSLRDTYQIRAERLLNTMWGHLGKIDSESEYAYLNKYFPAGVFDMENATQTKDYTALMSYKNKDKTSYVLYKEPVLTDYDNKYCIYWYRYEIGYQPKDGDTIMPAGWRRMSKSNADFSDPHGAPSDLDKINIGLSSEYYYTDDLKLSFKYEKQTSYKKGIKYYSFNEKKDKYEEDPSITSFEEFKEKIKKSDLYVRICTNDKGQIVHAPKTSSSAGYIERYMQYDLEKEKYVAVLFYNHTMYKSNELEFTNKDIIPDKATLDTGDILTFEHLTNSSDSYMVYSLENELMNSGDKNKHRQIRCHYDGLLAKDNALVSGQIFWYVPKVSTMLTVDLDDLLNKKKFVIDEKRTEYRTNKDDGSIIYEPVKFDSRKYQKDRYYIDKNGKYVICDKEPNEENAGHVPNGYSINSFFEKSVNTYCFYKTVTASEKEGTFQYEWEKYDFESDGIDSRDFWYKIKADYQDSAVNNYIKCVFIQKDGIDPVTGIQLFNFGVRGTCGTPYTLFIDEADLTQSTLPDQGLRLRSEIKDANNTSLNFGETISNFSVKWLGRLGGDEKMAPALEIDDGADTEKFFTAQKGCCGILQATGKILLKDEENVESSELASVAAGRTVDLEVRYSVPYAVDDYYIEGPTKIIYNSLGTLDNSKKYSNVKYKIFNRQTQAEIDGVEWSVEYYKINNRKFVPLSGLSDEEFYQSYMPKIEKNTLIPAPLYLDNLACYAILVAKDKSKNLLWRQPIIILQNRYSSSILNDWDGKFQINEENGTILGTMFAAGRKSSENTFEGVVMGDVALGTGSNIGFEESADNIGISNQTGLGIYGFNDGAQSFGFNIDGTAFLGKAGEGRIIFNGNSGTIASANWFLGSESKVDGDGNVTYPYGGKIDKKTGTISKSSDSGMCIDLDSGQIDAYNFKLTSNNIYLNSSPIDGHSHIADSKDIYSNYYLRIGENNKTGYIGLDSSGHLEIRVNSMQFTSQIGNENLFLQTSPRRSVNVPHWNEYRYTKIAEVDKDGKVTIESYDTLGYKSYPYDSSNAYHYTWGLNAWNLIYTFPSGTSSPSAWNHNNSYAGNSYVTRLNNLWRAKSAVNANELPPGNTDSRCKWDPQIDVSESDPNKLNSIVVKGNGSQLYQTMILKDETKYTVSGYIKASAANKKFGLILGSSNQYEIDYSYLDDEDRYPETMPREWVLPDTGWHYVQCTFWTPSSSNPDKKTTRRVGFTCEVPFEFWHAKLEQGSVATTWNPAPSDVEDNVEAKKNEYDYYLNQDAVFDKLFKDKKTGLYADGFAFTTAENSVTGLPELYINATYIATGILRSKNWDGKIRVERDSSNEKFEYSISQHPKFGMYMDLNQGKIWAAKFELNAWDYSNNQWDEFNRIQTTGKGLYLNSDPSQSPDADHQYYLKLGDTEKSYITFSGLGDFKMRVNSFELTSTFGGTNLLNDTAPRGNNGNDIRNADDAVPYGHWYYTSSQLAAKVSTGTTKGKAIRIHNIQDLSTTSKPYRRLYQRIGRLSESTQYMLSGWIHTPSINNQIRFRIKATSATDETNYVDYLYQADRAGWNFISHIFTIDTSVYTNAYFFIYDKNLSTFESGNIKNENYTYFHHLKLEQGTVATQWEESEQDKQDTLDIYDTEYLLQDVVFNKLTDNGNATGVFLNNGQLYINATYIASKIIRSSNWKATYKINGHSYNQNNLETAIKENPGYPVTDIVPTEGMYINLDNGQIWAEDFTLKAGTLGSDDYLGLYSSNQGSSTTINTNTTNTWRIIAGQKFGVTANGDLYASNAKITGNITANYLKANGGGEIAGWTIGSSTLSKNSITLNSDGSITGPGFTLNSSGCTIKKGSLEIGTTFKVTDAGVLTATGATLKTLTVKDTLTVKNADGSSTVLKVDNSGNLEFTGNITLGPLKKSGYTGAKKDGYTSFTVDLPWSQDMGELKFYNGILYGFVEAKKYTAQNFISWLMPKVMNGIIDIFETLFGIEINWEAGKDGVTNYDYSGATIGSITNPIYLSNGNFKEIGSTAEATAGKVLMALGKGNSPNWVSLTNFTTKAANRQYKISMTDDASHDLYTTIPQASDDGFGVVKTGYTQNGKNYPVKLSSGQMYVNVPWTTPDLSSASVSYATSAGNAGTVSVNATAGKYVASVSDTGAGTLVRTTSLQVSTVSTGSSKEYKNNIIDLDETDMLYKLRPVSFYYNKDMNLGNDKRYGFIAEEVELLDSNLVSRISDQNGKDNVAIYYNSILTLAVAEIQKLRKELDELKSNFNK